MNTRLIVAAIAFPFLLAALSPHCVAADLLMTGGGANQVVRFNGSTTTLFASDPDPSGSDSSPTKMHAPVALAYDTSGNLLVLNEFSKNVLKFNGTSGAFIGSFIDTATLGSHGISDPDDMEVGPDGNLYIMSHFNEGGNNIQKFDRSTGAYIGVFAAAGGFYHQHGLAFGPTGDAFQGHVDPKAIDRFNGPSGIPPGAFAGTFASDPGMSPILDLCFAPSGLYVTTGGAGVARFNSLTGAFMGYTVASGSYWGIAVDGPDLWISESAGTLKRYNATTGVFISDTVLAGGATDILPMVPEPSAACLMLGTISAVILSRRRHRRRRPCLAA